MKLEIIKTPLMSIVCMPDKNGVLTMTIKTVMWYSGLTLRQTKNNNERRTYRKNVTDLAN